MIKRKQKVYIIGAGVVGCAIAYVLSRNDNFQITVLEKNKTIPGLNQSSRNAGVIHAGIYYSKDEEPLKAKLCIEGNKLLYEFCKNENVPYKKTGKLIIASNKLEKEYLDYFYNRALINNVPGVTKILKSEIKKFASNISAKYAIFLPTSGIVEVDKYIVKLKELSEERGVEFLTSTKIYNILPKKKGYLIKTYNNKSSKTYNADIIINSAGLYSDTVAKMINKNSKYKIIPSRGEFAEFDNVSDLKVNMNIYPVPHGFYKSNGEKAEVGLKEFLKLHKAGLVTRSVGIHITPTISSDSSIGNISVIGPVKTVNISKNNYNQLLKNIDVFFNKIKALHTKLNKDKLRLHYAGIMAPEQNTKDFIIQKDEKYMTFINLIGIDSPGMTSSLAIAKYVSTLINS